ncbi:MAG: 2-oxoacid:acceptor oxidoreductase subunit alpha [Myxococcales bacterium]|nr:MAG: 2-oxoacid:acceptor oxidoreductase subunit alpha [Myxococcales bacterium]
MTTEQLENVVIRFTGDSGDGMQLTGTEFTKTSAIAGNDLATFPDFPAEIRAPAGTLAGVSGFQIHFSSNAVFTPGDAVDVLVAMNPAALKSNLADLKEDGVLILNSEGFNKRNLERVNYDKDPRQDSSLSKYRVFDVDITGMTLKAIEELKLNQRSAVRCKNFFALGLVYWMFNRDPKHTIEWVEKKFAKQETIKNANIYALKAGYAFGETSEVFTHNYIVKKADIPKGRYRNISGNEALALGMMAAAELSGLELFLGSYPITPASDVLHYLSRQKKFGVKTFQAEDEIAAISAAIGASFCGSLAATTTSGPGLVLKGEALGLANMLELPLLVIDIQRGGPSTGLPTKTEQADLMLALHGRNGESPLPIVAAKGPGDCFYAAIEAARIAVTHMTPVILLSDGYIANGAEPWPIPSMQDIPKIDVQFRTEVEGFQPYLRDPKTLARPWAIPGVPGLEHRVGGLEKQDVTGTVSYDPQNHEHMIKTRAAKVAAVADSLPPTEVDGDLEGDLLIVGWGSSHGAIEAALPALRSNNKKVGHIGLRYLNPLPKDLKEICGRYQNVLVPELNMGQLSKHLQTELGLKVAEYHKVQGKPFRVIEIIEAAKRVLEAN